MPRTAGKTHSTALRAGAGATKGAYAIRPYGREAKSWSHETIRDANSARDAPTRADWKFEIGDLKPAFTRLRRAQLRRNAHRVDAAREPLGLRRLPTANPIPGVTSRARGGLGNNPSARRGGLLL